MDAKERLEALKKFNSEMSSKNHFELLGVSQEATDADIRSAYFGLMKLYGADYFHQVTDPEDRKAVDEVNRRLRVAYDGIGKASKREEYLSSLQNGGSSEPASNVDFASVFEAEQALSISRTLMERGDFKVAIQKLEKARKLDGGSPEIEARIGYARFMLMDVDASGKRNAEEVSATRDLLEKLCESLPKADYIRVYLGDLENLEGDPDKSLRWYKEASKLNPDNLSAKRAIMMAETRKNTPKEPEAPKGFLDRLKELFSKKL